MFESVSEMEEVVMASGEATLFLEPRETFDRAIVGLADRAGGMCVVAYDRDACIQALMQDNDWDYETALEYFEFNTLGAWVGEYTPIFVELIAR